MKTFELPAGEYAIRGVRPSTLYIVAPFFSGIIVTPALPGRLGEALMLVLFVAVAFAMLVGAYPVRADVGDDGILLSWFWRRRFVPFRRVRSTVTVERTFFFSGRVDVLLDDGELLRLSTHTQRGGSRAMTDALAASLDRGRRAADAARRSAPLVQREQGESARAYVARARALLRGEATHSAFRGQSIPADALEAKLLDASAEPEERVGAALALRGSEARLTPDLVRVVADTTAHPALRIAVNADGAGDDDESVARALDRLEERGRRRGAE